MDIQTYRMPLDNNKDYILDYLADKVKEMDRYSISVGLTLMGSNSFKTFMGGCSSTCLVVFITYLSIYLFMKMVNNDDMTINYSRNFNDFRNTINEEQYIMKDELDFVLFINSDDVLGTDIYKYISVFYVTDDISQTEEENVNYIERSFLNISACSNFPGKYDFLSEKTAANSVCLEHSDLSIMANFVANNHYKEMVIHLMRCTNTTSNLECASDEQIDEFIKQTQIYLFKVDHQIDYTVTEGRPIQQVLGVDVVNLEHNRLQNVDIKVKTNEYSISSSYVFDSAREGTFYSYSDATQTNGRQQYGRDVVLEVKFQMDPIQDYYEARFYSFWDFTSQVGGVFEVFEIILGIFNGYYNAKFMDFNAINDYWLNKHHLRKSDDKTKSTAADNVQSFVNRDSRNRHSHSISHSFSNYEFGHLLTTTCCFKYCCPKLKSYRKVSPSNSDYKDSYKQFVKYYNDKKLDINRILANIDQLKYSVNKIKRSTPYHHINNPPPPVKYKPNSIAPELIQPPHHHTIPSHHNRVHIKQSDHQVEMYKSDTNINNHK